MFIDKLLNFAQSHKPDTEGLTKFIDLESSSGVLAYFEDTYSNILLIKEVGSSISSYIYRSLSIIDNGEILNFLKVPSREEKKEFAELILRNSLSWLAANMRALWDIIMQMDIRQSYAIETFSVGIDNLGRGVLLYNPKFLCYSATKSYVCNTRQNPADIINQCTRSVSFILSHEAYHVYKGHVNALNKMKADFYSNIVYDSQINMELMRLFDDDSALDFLKLEGVHNGYRFRFNKENYSRLLKEEHKSPVLRVLSEKFSEAFSISNLRSNTFDMFISFRFLFDSGFSYEDVIEGMKELMLKYRTGRSQSSLADQLKLSNKSDIEYPIYNTGSYINLRSPNSFYDQIDSIDANSVTLGSNQVDILRINNPSTLAGLIPYRTKLGSVVYGANVKLVTSIGNYKIGDLVSYIKNDVIEKHVVLGLDSNGDYILRNVGSVSVLSTKMDKPLTDKIIGSQANLLDGTLVTIGSVDLSTGTIIAVNDRTGEVKSGLYLDDMLIIRKDTPAPSSDSNEQDSEEQEPQNSSQDTPDQESQNNESQEGKSSSDLDQKPKSQSGNSSDDEPQSGNSSDDEPQDNTEQGDSTTDSNSESSDSNTNDGSSQENSDQDMETSDMTEDEIKEMIENEYNENDTDVNSDIDGNGELETEEDLEAEELLKRADEVKKQKDQDSEKPTEPQESDDSREDFNSGQSPINKPSTKSPDSVPPMELNIDIKSIDSLVKLKSGSVVEAVSWKSKIESMIQNATGVKVLDLDSMPSRRISGVFDSEEDIPQFDTIVLMFDTSGSMDQNTYKKCLKILYNVLDTPHFKDSNFWIMHWDNSLHSYKKITKYNKTKLASAYVSGFSHQGGTYYLESYAQVMNKVKKVPDIIFNFTDGDYEWSLEKVQADQKLYKWQKRTINIIINSSLNKLPFYPSSGPLKKTFILGAKR